MAYRRECKIRGMKRLLAAFLLALSLAATCQSSDQLARLANPATTDAERTELIARGSHDPSMRSGLSRALPAMLLAAQNNNVVASEARLAGGLKLESTIPALVARLADHIGMENMTTIYRGSQLLDDPVARALYEIRRPALPALTEALKSSNYLQRSRAMGVLVLTDTEESQAILRTHLPVEPDSHLRHYLELNLDRQAKQGRVAHP
jgi:hypothetical protein